MTYLSVCSGIEAATVAWHPLGFTPAAFSEIDKFPCAVLSQHYPDVPNWGDLTKFKDWPDADIDLLVGGTPCQSFSVAGLREGLDDPRGQLTLTYLAVARKYRPTWLVWENVPGVLSADDGRAFGSLLGGLAELGYGFAYRILDAQYFGLAQRRKRVFVVGHLGDWRRAAAVLFERESLSGHPAPRREAGEAAPAIPSRRTAGGGLGTDFDCDGGLIPGIAKPLGAHALSKGRGTDLDNTTYIAHGFVQNQRDEVRVLDVAGALAGEPGMKQQTYIAHALKYVTDVSLCLNAGGMGRIDAESETLIAHSLKADGFDASEDGTGRGTPIVPVALFDERTVTSPPDNRQSCAVDGAVPTLHTSPFTLAIRGRGDSHDLEYRQDGTANAVLTPNGGRAGIGVGAVAVGWSEELTAHVELAGTIQRGGDGGRHEGVMTPAMQVRRLTPRECERLQGFPDDYTLIPYRGKPAADGPRYKALGNSMAVPVMHWIGKQIQMVDALG